MSVFRTLAVCAMIVALPALANAKAKEPAKPRTAESIECSKEADAKGLHGKERKTFRAECKKTHKAASATTATTDKKTETK